MHPLEGLFGPGPKFWEGTGFWAAICLLAFATLVPGGALMPVLEARRRRARGLAWAGAGAWLVFHGWGAWRVYDYLQDIRRLGAMATPRDHAIGLVSAGRALFCGWVCFAMSVLFAGIVLRGTRGGRLIPWALLAVLGIAVAIGQAIVPEPMPHDFLPMTLTWEAYQLPLAALAGLVALFVGIGAAFDLRRASRGRDAAAFERQRLRLAGAGLVLVSAAVLVAIIRGFHYALNAAVLGPKLMPRDIQAGLRFMLVTPAVFAFLGLIAAAFGLVHLRSRGESLEPAGGPPDGGADPAP